MKATERQLRFVTRQDPDTGARVTRLTPTDVTCHRNYFYQKCFTNDGSKLLFAGEFGPQGEMRLAASVLEQPQAHRAVDRIHGRRPVECDDGNAVFDRQQKRGLARHCRLNNRKREKETAVAR